jgi:hypothetical protein
LLARVDADEDDVVFFFLDFFAVCEVLLIGSVSFTAFPFGAFGSSSLSGAAVAAAAAAADDEEDEYDDEDEDDEEDEVLDATPPAPLPSTGLSSSVLR